MHPLTAPRTLLVMGVCGSGKSTVGSALAERLGARFADADDFHPPDNVKKMESGTPLTDADRAGWLRSLNDWLRASERAHEKQHLAVLACSALRPKYREILFDDLEAPCTIIYLKATYAEILPRMQAREGHFMPAELLRSQFDTLEEPDKAIVVSATLPVQEIVDRCCTALRAGTPPGTNRAGTKD